MSVVSSPIPGASAPTGEDHNALRNDVLYNHAHTGGNNGHTISHLSLTDVGTNTHAQIDASIGAIQAKTSFTGLQAGRWVPPAGGNYYYGSSPWLQVSVAFPTAFASPPKVIVTLNSSGAPKRVFAPTVKEITTTGCNVYMYSGEIIASDPNHGSYDMEQYIGFDWIAIST